METGYENKMMNGYEMKKYVVQWNLYTPEKVYGPGDVIELSDEDAAVYMAQAPGLLSEQSDDKAKYV